MDREAFKRLQEALAKSMVPDSVDDFYGGPYMKLWSAMTEEERAATKTWWEEN